MSLAALIFQFTEKGKKCLQLTIARCTECAYFLLFNEMIGLEFDCQRLPYSVSPAAAVWLKKLGFFFVFISFNANFTVILEAVLWEVYLYDEC